MEYLGKENRIGFISMEEKYTHNIYGDEMIALDLILILYC